MGNIFLSPELARVLEQMTERPPVNKLKSLERHNVMDNGNFRWLLSLIELVFGLTLTLLKGTVNDWHGFGVHN